MEPRKSEDGEEKWEERRHRRGEMKRSKKGKLGQAGEWRGGQRRSVIDIHSLPTLSAPLSVWPAITPPQIMIYTAGVNLTTNGDRLSSVSFHSAVVVFFFFFFFLHSLPRSPLFLSQWWQMAWGPWHWPRQIDYWSGGQRWIEGVGGSWSHVPVQVEKRKGYRGYSALREGLKVCQVGERRATQRTVCFSAAVTLRGSYWPSSSESKQPEVLQILLRISKSFSCLHTA